MELFFIPSPPNIKQSDFTIQNQHLWFHIAIENLFKVWKHKLYDWDILLWQSKLKVVPVFWLKRIWTKDYFKKWQHCPPEYTVHIGANGNPLAQHSINVITTYHFPINSIFFLSVCTTIFFNEIAIFQKYPRHDDVAFQLILPHLCNNGNSDSKNWMSE